MTPEVVQPEWQIDPFGRSDKHIEIRGPGLTLMVDYDDVDHDDVDTRVEQLLTTLNAATLLPHLGTGPSNV